jgi:hypothetical protein
VDLKYILCQINADADKLHGGLLHPAWYGAQVTRQMQVLAWEVLANEEQEHFHGRGTVQEAASYENRRRCTNSPERPFHSFPLGNKAIFILLKLAI